MSYRTELLTFQLHLASAIDDLLEREERKGARGKERGKREVKRGWDICKNLKKRRVYCEWQ